MRNACLLCVLLASSGSVFAGGFAAPIVSQITTVVPPPILVSARQTAEAPVINPDKQR